MNTPDKPAAQAFSRATRTKVRPRLQPHSYVRSITLCALLLTIVFSLSCGHAPDPNTVVMIIESSPSNLDPRVGIDAQSERIGELIFDSLVHRDEHFNVQPWLAESWETPDPLTWVFHLRSGVAFHDGRPLTSRDVKWTFDSIFQGELRTPKRGAFQLVERVDAPDERTVVFRLKEAWASLLWNVSNGSVGIVPYGSGAEFNRNPVGSGPFRFVSAQQDQEVILERNESYWGERAHIARVRFMVVPDTTTRALELRKGSADIAVNAVTSDMALTLEHDPELVVTRSPGTIYTYLAVNLRDPVLKDVRVRRALAYAINREPVIEHLWRNFARPAKSILPTQSWAYNGEVRSYPHDPEMARRLLDEAGYAPGPDGVRFHLTMKTSTEESTRLLAAVLQQQLREVGIALDIRSYEFATFFADVVKGAFQIYSVRWIGGNNDPDIFEYVFHSSRVPPRGANRGFYSNPRADELIDRGRRETDMEKRKAIYAELQSLLADDLPYIHLWYLDNIVIHSRRVSRVEVGPSGSYDFLKTLELRPST
ncbi:MAG: ABC transporter substrate-binding protein [Candidatus Korobacteraceae bacterium]